MEGITAKRIKSCRESKGLSKTELAKATGLTISAISQFEAGDRDPALESLKKLADAFDVTADYLMGREEETADNGMQVMFRGLQKMNEKDRETMMQFYNFLKSKKKAEE